MGKGARERRERRRRAERAVDVQDQRQAASVRAEEFAQHWRSQGREAVVLFHEPPGAPQHWAYRVIVDGVFHGFVAADDAFLPMRFTTSGMSS